MGLGAVADSVEELEGYSLPSLNLKENKTSCIDTLQNRTTPYLLMGAPTMTPGYLCINILLTPFKSHQLCSKS